MNWLTRTLGNRSAQRAERRNMMVFGSLFMRANEGGTYATDLWYRLGGSSGAIYRALWSLEEDGLVVGEWDDSEPPRRVYSVAEEFRPVAGGQR